MSDSTVDAVKQLLPAIKDNPVEVGIIAIALFAAGFTLAWFLRSSKIEALDQQVQTVHTQMELAKDQLAAGGSPDEILKKIDSSKIPHLP